MPCFSFFPPFTPIEKSLVYISVSPKLSIYQSLLQLIKQGGDFQNFLKTETSINEGQSPEFALASLELGIKEKIIPIPIFRKWRVKKEKEKVALKRLPKCYIYNHLIFVSRYFYLLRFLVY